MKKLIKIDLRCLIYSPDINIFDSDFLSNCLINSVRNNKFNLTYAKRNLNFIFNNLLEFFNNYNIFDQKIKIIIFNIPEIVYYSGSKIDYI